ncbi:MAG: hypothetical protein FJX76_20960 [Armatimonadetes bacterium]|nr:hypothetical protein [Armatimonadota bacterium]
MIRTATLVLLVIAVVIAAAIAKPRVRSVALDDGGQARVALTQRQIFDEIEGQAGLDLDLIGGLAALNTALQLPEEAGDISGEAYLGMQPGAVFAVGDFSYLPLKRKQIKLDMDYSTVENTDRSRGTNIFTVDYPLSLENRFDRPAGSDT